MKKSSELADILLVQQYQAGDDKSFGVIFSKYHASIEMLIRTYVQDEDIAQDLTQDVFEKALTWIKNNSYDADGGIKPWLVRIATNICMDYFRKQQRVRKTIDAFPLSEINDDNETMEMFDDYYYRDIERILINKDCRDEAVMLIRCLCPEQKEVLLMRYYCNLSFRQITEVFGESINTTLGRMRYALRNLQKLQKTMMQKEATVLLSA